MSNKTNSSKLCCNYKILTRTLPLSEVYLGPNQTSMMEFFEKQFKAESY